MKSDKAITLFKSVGLVLCSLKCLTAPSNKWLLLLDNYQKSALKKPPIL